MIDKRYYVDIDEAIIDNETHRQYETWNLVDIEALCDKLNELNKESELLKSRLSFSHREIDKLRKILNDNRSMAEVVMENKKLKQIIDEADDLIKSHLSSHYNRKWENYCRSMGFDLNEEVKNYD